MDLFDLNQIFLYLNHFLFLFYFTFFFYFQPLNTPRSQPK